MPEKHVADRAFLLDAHFVQQGAGFVMGGSCVWVASFYGSNEFAAPLLGGEPFTAEEYGTKLHATAAVKHPAASRIEMWPARQNSADLANRKIVGHRVALSLVVPIRPTNKKTAVRTGEQGVPCLLVGTAASTIFV
jgi:hypothetical protein